MSLRTPLTNHEIEALLGGREPAPACSPPLCPSPVLVVGAAGSIGRMLVAHLASTDAEVIALDQDEAGLFEISEELRELGLDRRVRWYLEDAAHSLGILRRERPRTILHAAAYKHVPLLEANPRPALRNNLLLTWKLAQAALSCGVERFVMISTDKAVQPISIMGWSKRAAESVVTDFDTGNGLRALSLRLPNILGSSGSVAQIFKARLSRGLPLQITSAAAERSFLSPRGAVTAILQAAAAQGASLYAMHGHAPLAMTTLAERATALWGQDSQPAPEFIGLRPGERLREAMWEEDELLSQAAPHGLRALRSSLPAEGTQGILREIEVALQAGEEDQALACLRRFLPSSPDPREIRARAKTHAESPARS
jgi:FlaA1/EpsC-like NDP-sugar epimerase